MEPTARLSSRSESPVSCEKCFISYVDFGVLYSGEVDLLVSFALTFGLLLAENKCSKVSLYFG